MNAATALAPLAAYGSSTIATTSWAAAVDALVAAAPLEDAVAGVRRARRARPVQPVAPVSRPPVTRAGLSAWPWLDVVPLKNKASLPKYC